MIQNKKSSIILVLKILQEYTDEDHYLTQSEILDLIYQNYDIELERKSIGSSLSLLEELGYDINKGKKGGFALLSRTFHETEAQYIIDAIFSSRSISGKQAIKIAEEVSSCFSKYQRKDYSYIYKTTEVTRTDNKQVLYNISVIHEAMRLKKRVTFHYLTFDENGNKTTRMNGYDYIVSPYYLINNFGRYYLLCNYRSKYQALQVFRVDYMIDIAVKEDWDIKPFSGLGDEVKDFSISEYLSDHIYLFGGDVIEAVVELTSPNSIQAVDDWFGKKAKVYKKDDKLYCNIKCDEGSLFYWLLQYGDEVTIVSPQHIVDKIKKHYCDIMEKYK